ncbi:MAG: hypothetical protein PHI28_18205, partial [Mangrovibacterium sp.]|nr:hypothetical protein [Mangrovibacterium sp.]
MTKNNTLDSGEKMNRPENSNRRTLIKALASVPLLGIFAYEASRNRSYAREKQNRVIRELGLENLQSPKTWTALRGNGGDRLRIGFIGFGSRAVQLARGLGFISPGEKESRQTKGNLES